MQKLTGKNNADTQDLEHVFDNNSIAKGYLEQGRIQLNDIANGDNGWWFIGKNKANVDIALQTATHDEKTEYQAGKQLALSSQQDNLTAVQKNSVDFYKSLHKALDKIGDAKDLAHGETCCRTKRTLSIAVRQAICSAH